MKIIVLPKFDYRNPYQKNLADALEKKGHTVILSDISGWFAVLRTLRKYGKPNILHVHWTHYYLLGKSKLESFVRGAIYILEILVSKLIGIKIIWTMHNIVNHEKHQVEVEIFFNKILVRLYDGIVVHCRYALDAAIQTYRVSQKNSPKIKVIPHGNYINNYENKVSKAEARSLLDLNEDQRVFLFFGGIRSYKGLDNLIESFRSIEQHNVILLIAGNPVSEFLKEDILKCCQTDHRIKLYLDFIPENKVQVFFNAADILVFPFEDILTSGSMLLAMSFAKPVIVPSSGCIPEDVDPQGSILYNPKEEEGLQKALGEALTLDFSSMGNFNYEKAKKVNWSQIAEKTDQLFKNVAN